MNYYSNNGGFLSNVPAVTKNLLIVNVFFFIFWLLRPEFMEHTFALYYPNSPYFHWWQPLTYMFMHGGFWHIFMNMFVLLMFGNQLESVWGPKKYLYFYFITGLGAAALHIGTQWLQIQHYIGQIASDGTSAIVAVQSINAIKMIPTVGASGAIYGLLMGFAMLFPDARLTLIFPPISLKAKWWVVIWFVLELFFGVTGSDGVAHFAHLGGMIFGALLILYWKKKGRMYEYEQ